MNRTVKNIFEIRSIPPSAYRLEKDGLKWKRVCARRQMLAWQIASYAEEEAPSISTLAVELGLSEKTITSLLDDLAQLGMLENEKPERQWRQRSKVDFALALELWNTGTTITELAARFQCTRSAAHWAVERAEELGLGVARRGSMKRTPDEIPPMLALFSPEHGTEIA